MLQLQIRLTCTPAQIHITLCVCNGALVDKNPETSQVRECQKKKKQCSMLPGTMFFLSLTQHSSMILHIAVANRIPVKILPLPMWTNSSHSKPVMTLCQCNFYYKFTLNSFAHPYTCVFLLHLAGHQNIRARNMSSQHSFCFCWAPQHITTSVSLETCHYPWGNFRVWLDKKKSSKPAYALVREWARASMVMHVHKTCKHTSITMGQSGINLGLLQNFICCFVCHHLNIAMIEGMLF